MAKKQRIKLINNGLCWKHIVTIFDSYLIVFDFAKLDN